MNIQALVHLNINCSDFDVSRVFYEKLGFEVYLEVPPRNTPQVAAAVGFRDYELRGALMRHRSGRAPFVIDLLEWRSPRNDEAPYKELNHLGIARVAMATSDLDADTAELNAMGVEFVGEEATVEWNGRPSSRFVCFKDPDGTVLELVQDLTSA
ncbi:MAG: catechol 2,3-dioxygenase-like lactoylglutathione lyase family enzyme [Myxococcota bacterium]|jgi:catechol 2,3-dioxygenase-like lactoylglutathione lyase family enzyme